MATTPYARRGDHAVRTMWRPLRPHDAATTRSVRTTRRPRGPHDAATTPSARRGDHSVRTPNTSTTRSVRSTRRPRGPHDAATTPYARRGDHAVRTMRRPLRPHDAATTRSVRPTRRPRGPYARRGNHSVRTLDAASTWSVRTTQRNARCIGMHDAGPTPRGMGISRLACRDAPNSLILFLMQLLLWRVRLSDKQRSDARRNHVVDGPTKHLRVAITILKAVSVHLPPMDRLGRVRGYRLHPALAAFHRRHRRHHRYHHQNHRLPASPISTRPV